MTAGADLADALRRAGIEVGPGLTAAEHASLEERFGFRFPADLADLLRAGVPSGDRFPDWHGGPDAVADRMNAPVEGLLFDVEHNLLWLPEWGERPPLREEAVERARDALANVPRLVPVWAHRYLPSEPPRPGNPVLSVMQADIVVYGSDLAGYFAREFHVVIPAGDRPATPAADVPFWSIFLD